MMDKFYSFGAKLQKVEQQDKSPKKVFVLGVYASAVHAKWLDINGKVKVNALAVASEPYIFWNGNGAKEIIDRIKIPSILGTLVPADERFNGPSGKALDDLFLKPLGYKREDAWLCDLLPFSRINPSQLKAIERVYNPLIKEYNLPECTIPEFSPAELKNPSRVDEIVTELEESNADTIILLGDLPIKYFLSYFTNYKKLSDFGNLVEEYGIPHPININGKTYQIIPLVHPRQAARLGNSNENWALLHAKWILYTEFGYLNKEDKEINRVSEIPQKCPVCNSGKIATYLWGLPIYSKELEIKINEGKIILGGCCITGDDPFCACMDCKTDFYKLQI